MKVCNEPVRFGFIVLRCNTVRQNEIYFISYANHHAHEYALLTLHVHAKGVKRSNTNEMDRYKENEFPVIPSTPHQPDEFAFPKRLCGSSMRSFRAPWFKEFKFLHYDEAKDVVFCHTCVTAFQQKKVKGANAEPSFVSRFDPSTIL